MFSTQDTMLTTRAARKAVQKEPCTVKPTCTNVSVIQLASKNVAALMTSVNKPRVRKDQPAGQEFHYGPKKGINQSQYDCHDCHS